MREREVDGFPRQMLRVNCGGHLNTFDGWSGFRCEVGISCPCFFSLGEGCRSASMDVWRNTGFFVLRPVCSLIGVSVIGFFLAQATFDAVILGIYPFGAALGRVRVQDVYKLSTTAIQRWMCRLCHQAAVSHLPSNTNIGALGRTCTCP